MIKEQATAQPTLYKIGGIGQTLQWDIDVHEVADGTGALIIIDHGQVDGKIQVDKELITEGKNIGRANETTPWQQAVSQAESRWKKQWDGGYRETIDEAHDAAKASTKPMLAHKLVDKAHKLVPGRTYGSQAKLDGMRCIAHWVDGEVELLSRKGKLIESVPHINAELKKAMWKGDVWDGELYVHGMEFEEIMSICKRKVKNMHPGYLTMEFHVFDLVSDMDYLSRNEHVSMAIALQEGGPQWVHTVPWMPVTYENEDQLVDLAEKFEKLGYEGLILRDLGMPYEHKRSLQLIKVKRFIDAEYLIKGTEEGKRGTDQEGLLIKFDIVYTRKDKGHGGELDSCDATLMGTEVVRREMLTRRDSYHGLYCTVKYQELSKKGAPRFAKVKAIRDMEDLQPVY